MKQNIKDMSKEQKLALLDLIEEKKRRLREAKDVYTPNTGQRPVHVSQKRNRFVFSGNGAGKTALSANEALWAVQGYNPITKRFTKVPARIIILLDHPEKVTDVWLPELQKWTNIKPEQLHQRGKSHVSRISFPNGSEILFMFHQQEPMIFESIELDFLIADEPPPRKVWISLNRGGRKKISDPRFLVVGTPISGSWIRREVHEPWSRGDLPNTDCFRFGTIVNERNLAAGYIEQFSSLLSDKEKRVRLQGEWFDLEGLALAHLWKREEHIVPPIIGFEGHVVIGIDPHPNKNHIAVMLGLDRDGEYYVLRELSSERADTPRTFARKLRNWYKGYKVLDINCDSLGAARLTGGDGNKTFIEVLNEEGIRARSTTYDDKKEDSWIMKIQEYLKIPTKADNFGRRRPKLHVCSTSVGVISDVESVSWLKWKNSDENKPKLDITNKDYLAALKYALACNLYKGKEKQRMYIPTNLPSSYGLKRPSLAKKSLSNK